MSSESNEETIPSDAEIYKQMVYWKRSEDSNSNLNNSELNTYPDLWLIFTTIMSIMSYVGFSLRTRGFSWTDLPLLSLTKITMFIKGKRVTPPDPKPPKRAHNKPKPLQK